MARVATTPPLFPMQLGAARTIACDGCTARTPEPKLTRVTFDGHGDIWALCPDCVNEFERWRPLVVVPSQDG